MSIADNLQKLRKNHQLSQEQMAEILAMSKNGYGKLERDESKMTVERLQTIAHIFNIDISVLLKEHDELYGGGESWGACQLLR